jgi:NTP pyrophosphatase (non-canonical NTP hydrolase)
MEISELVVQAHDNAVKKGFWDNYLESQIIHPVNSQYEKNNAIGTMLMLIVTELGEALEGLRHNDIDNFREELADVAIRLGDMCGGLGIDLEAEILKKMEINKARPRMHGKEF